MKDLLKSGLATALTDRFGIAARVQRLVFVDELAIVMYHGVLHEPLPVPDWCFIEKRRFVDQMRYLSQRCRVLPLADSLALMREGALDEPTVAITFDDGFQSVHDVAFPIMQQLRLPSTVFLATDFVDTPRTIWFCELIQSLSVTSMQELTWRNRRYDLGGRTARATASAELQNILKELSHDQLHGALREIQLALGVDIERISVADAPFRVLDASSIARMTASGLVEFGAHTGSHSILTRVEREQARAEIQRSVKRTAKLTGAPCRLFAYPNGRKRDYDEVIMRLLRGAGISSAVTTLPGPNKVDTPDLELRRYGVGPRHSLARFQADVHHLLSHVAIRI